MPLQATSGAASYDAFGGGVAAVPTYIEDIFGTFLYTGNGSTQTINNGVDLAGKGGLVWGKNRSAAANNFLANTVLGASNGLISNSTGGNTFDPDRLTAFTASGFSVGSSGSLNTSGNNYASWTWAEAPKFFDVVTYTGNNTAGRTVAHNLGSAPGCIIVKQIDGGGPWTVYHRSPGATKYLILNNTDAEQTFSGTWNNTAPTATEFTLGASGFVNAPGAQYVAYLFAHNAGGFGLTGTDNVISCGSYTGAYPSNVTVNLGFEPQFILVKNTTDSSDWFIYDTMRGMDYTSGKSLAPNSSAAENGVSGNSHAFSPTATGFIVESGLTAVNVSGSNHIYIAIRRGPMRTPTTGTSVFAPVAQNSAGTVTTNFPVDLMLGASRNIAHNTYALDRLRGSSTSRFAQLRTDTTSAESSGTGVGIGLDNNTGFVDNWFIPSGSGAASGSATAYWNFRRAPGFFDVVCYNGSSSTQTITHNLTVAPELIIVKKRAGGTARGWGVYPNDPLKRLLLNSDVAASFDTSYWNDTAATASAFTVDTSDAVNGFGFTFVAYLFASCPGVSKVGTYTGTGTTQLINCGFTGGARFVLIKRTDSTGDWFVWDSARGMIPANDPYLLLNSTAAEVTGTDFVDTAATGFEITSTAPAAINASGGTFIFLAIA